MAARKQQEFATVLKTDPLTLTCEWQDCQDVYDDMDAFCDHLEEHLRAFVPPDVPEDTSMTCEWQECGHEMSCILELVRHVYFHAFHVKIKSSGYTLILKNKWRGCRLESASRNTIPDLPDRFHCLWASCSGIFDNPDLFYKHVRSHGDCYPEGNHVPEGCRCQWSDCELTLKSKHKLKAHLRSHTQEKTVACPSCGSLFSTSTRFLDHIKRQQDCDEGSQYYQCSYCNKRFPSERILKDHMRHHVNHYKCPFCEMTCPSPSNLKMHIDYKHSDGKAHKCSHCDFSAKTLNDIRRHTERMHARSLLKCEVQECNFKCRNLSEYKHHYRIAHEGHDKPYLCHVCGEGFKRGTRLTTHLKKKHKFKWLPGHSRFRFKQHEDGYYRLQTVRYESVEISPGESPQTQHTSVLSENTTGSCSGHATSDPIPKTGKRKSLKPSRRKSVGSRVKKATVTENANNSDSDVAITLVSKGKKRKKKKASEEDLSYNLEMLGDVALNLPRDRGDVEGGRVVKLQRMSESEMTADQGNIKRDLTTVQTRGARKSQLKQEPVHSMPTGGELMRALQGTSYTSPRKSRSPVKGNIWKNFGTVDPSAIYPSESQESEDLVALDLSQNAAAEHTTANVHSDTGDGVVASLLDASGKMVYVTSDVPVNFADSVQVVEPGGSVTN